jgi:hypothetical protein
MVPGLLSNLKSGDFFFLTLVAIVAGAASFTVFMACFYWFRREQRRLHGRMLSALTQSDRDGLGDSPQPWAGELVAQFRAKEGRQVISVLEADGKRFLHIDGEISAKERARMVRYLKSEGFMS